MEDTWTKMMVGRMSGLVTQSARTYHKAITFTIAQRQNVSRLAIRCQVSYGYKSVLQRFAARAREWQQQACVGERTGKRLSALFKSKSAGNLLIRRIVQHVQQCCEQG